MNIIWTVLIGLCTGLIDKALARRRESGALVRSATIGISGAVLAFYAGDLTGWNKIGTSVSVVGAVIGAASLLAIYRLSRSKPS